METAMRTGCNDHGFTLAELLVVIAIVGILAGISALGLKPIFNSWRLRDASNQVLENMRRAQDQAMQAGDYSLEAGTGKFRTRRVFMVFDVANRSYQPFLWTDRNNDDTPDNGESLAIEGANTLPDGINFGTAHATKSACSNSNASSLTRAVTFTVAAYQPCNGNPCVKFNKFGFLDRSGGIYMHNGEKSTAISPQLPGHMTMCTETNGVWN
jgi:prepilin-type N-terminal cleavage/methylation domain-containing protein